MRCSRCGNEVDEKNQFCKICSQALLNDNKPNRSDITLLFYEAEKRDSLFKVLVMFSIGLLSYPVINYFFITRRICEIFAVAVHELSHTAMNLIFGRLAIPGIDLIFASGITIYFDSGKGGRYFIICLMVILIYLTRKKLTIMISIIISILFYIFIAFSAWMEILVVAAGHLGEVFFVGLAFYRCLIAIKTKIYERPLYAILGWWTLMNRVIFFGNLSTNVNAKIEYMNTGIVTPDLVVLSEELMNIRFETVAQTFQLLYFVPLIVMVILSLKRKIWIQN